MTSSYTTASEYFVYWAERAGEPVTRTSTTGVTNSLPAPIVQATGRVDRRVRVSGRWDQMVLIEMMKLLSRGETIEFPAGSLAGKYLPVHRKKQSNPGHPTRTRHLSFFEIIFDQGGAARCCASARAPANHGEGIAERSGGGVLIVRYLTQSVECLPKHGVPFRDGGHPSFLPRREESHTTNISFLLPMHTYDGGKTIRSRISGTGFRNPFPGNTNKVTPSLDYAIALLRRTHDG